jgi:hypothetical protein
VNLWQSEEGGPQTYICDSFICLQIILPPLFYKLDTLPDGDRELLPLMECLTTGTHHVSVPMFILPLCGVSTHSVHVSVPCRSSFQGTTTDGAVCSVMFLPLHRVDRASRAGLWPLSAHAGSLSI